MRAIGPAHAFSVHAIPFAGGNKRAAPTERRAFHLRDPSRRNHSDREHDRRRVRQRFTGCRPRAAAPPRTGRIVTCQRAPCSSRTSASRGAGPHARPAAIAMAMARMARPAHQTPYRAGYSDSNMLQHRGCADGTSTATLRHPKPRNFSVRVGRAWVPRPQRLGHRTFHFGGRSNLVTRQRSFTLRRGAQLLWPPNQILRWPKRWGRGTPRPRAPRFFASSRAAARLASCCPPREEVRMRSGSGMLPWSVVSATKDVQGDR